MLKRFQNGFTIIEIMVVVVLVGLLLGMAVPNYLKSRKESRKQTCIANLWSLNEAVKQWVLENNIVVGASIAGNEDAIYDYLRRKRATCPDAGTYTFGIVGVEPQVECSREQDLLHKLPD